MSDLIVSRTAVEMPEYPTTWLVADSVEGLGLEHCGCPDTEHNAVSRLTAYHGPSTIEVVFIHGATRCMMAFNRDNFAPLSWEDYKTKFPKIAPDDDEQ